MSANTATGAGRKLDGTLTGPAAPGAPEVDWFPIIGAPLPAVAPDGPAPDAGQGDAVTTGTTTQGQGSAAAVTSPETVTYGGSGLVFINTYGSGVTTAFRNEIVAAENYFQAHFSSACTIRCSFNLQSLNRSFSAENTFNPAFVSYSSLRSALQSHATSPDQLAAATALNSLADPSNGAGFSVSIGEARILGLAGAGSTIDDTVTLNSLYWTSQTLQSSPGDAIAVVEHEISEGALGRIGGGAQDGWAPMDLFRFTAGGQRDFTGGQDGQPTYFSPDGNNVYTGLQYHNPINAFGQDDGFDWADWDGVGADANDTDPFGPGGPGTGDPGRLSITDLRIMNVLGWHRRLGPESDFTGSDAASLLWRNNSTGEVDTWQFANGQMSGSTVVGTESTAWRFAGAGDFNGDFTSDVLWQNTATSEVDAWLVNNGQLSNAGFVSFASSAWQSLGTGNFNADNASDVLWRNANTGEVDTWLMNNGQMIGGAALGSVSSTWRFAGIGDFNGDGTSDVLWQNVNTGEIDTWLVGNDHLTGGTAIGQAASVWQPLGIGDFNKDGTSDVLWRNSTTGEVDDWIMQNGHMIGGTALGTVTTAWQFAAIGPFNGDGTCDVVWRNSATGAVDLWTPVNGQYTDHMVGSMSSAWQVQPIVTA
jgi:hypothetical protein